VQGVGGGKRKENRPTRAGSDSRENQRNGEIASRFRATKASTGAFSASQLKDSKGTNDLTWRVSRSTKDGIF